MMTVCGGALHNENSLNISVSPDSAYAHTIYLRRGQMETIADVTDTSLTWCDFGDFTDIPFKGIR